MKIQVVNYTFDASAGTVTFTDYGTIRQDSILLVTNVTDNIIIYNFADATKGGSVGTNILTLDFDTSSMDDSDDLLIYYDDKDYVQTVDTTLDISDLALNNTFIDGDAKVQLVDGSNIPLSITGGKLDVNADLGDVGTDISSIESQQTDGSAKTQVVDGTNTNIDFATESTLNDIKTAVQGTLDVDTGLTVQTDALTDSELRASPIPVSATDLDIRNLTSTDVITAELSPVDNAVLDAIAAKDFATQTTLSAMNAKMVSGTDIGDVTINNASGASAVNIQDGGNVITVDGTVAVTNSDLTSIKNAVEIIDNAIAGNEMQVDIVTIPNVTIGAALPAGTNGIGKLTANSGVDIGDVDVTSLPAIPAGTNLIGRTSSSDETSTIYDGTTALTPKYAVIDVASSGDNTVLAAVSSKKIRVLSLLLVAAGTVNVRFESGASGTALSGQMNLIANTGFTLPYNPVGWFETASNTLLNLELSGAISVDGMLTYVEV